MLLVILGGFLDPHSLAKSIRTSQRGRIGHVSESPNLPPVFHLSPLRAMIGMRMTFPFGGATMLLGAVCMRFFLVPA